MSFCGKDVWYPTQAHLAGSNLAKLFGRMGLASYDEFLKVTVNEPWRYWNETLRHMDITFDPPATGFVDVSRGKPWARFFPGAGFNVAECCLRPPAYPDGPNEPPVMGEDEPGHRSQLSYGQLADRTRRFAAGLAEIGILPGDRVGLFFHSSPDAM